MSSKISIPLSLRKLMHFIGTKNTISLTVSMSLGGMMFFAEIYFIYSFQLFLSYIGLIETQAIDIPSWLQFDKGYSVLIFSVMALIRIFLLSMKTLLSSTINQSFLRLQRERVMTIGLLDSPAVSSHEIISMFSDKISRAGSVLSDFSSLLMSIITAGAIFFWGLVNAPKEMLSALVLISLVVIPLRYFDTKIREEGKGIDKSWENANKTLLEGIRHFFYLFYHGLISDEINKGNTELKNYEHSYKKFYQYSVAKNALPQVAGVLSLIFISIISKKYFGTAPAILLSFLYLFTRLAQGMSELVYLKGCLALNYPSFMYVFNFQEKFLKIDNTEIQNSDYKNHIGINHISLKNLSFSYVKNSSKLEVFNDFNLDIKKGTPLIIKGPSGVGKSTLVSILLGYNRNFEGLISIDDKNIKDILGNLRHEISYVGPEPFLFEDTIFNNLTFGLKEINKSVISEEINLLLKRMKLWDYVERQPRKLDSKIAEFADLSTGQKQRLSLIRALLRKPSLLVLDEATANIDRETEKIIIEIIGERHQEMMVVVITHKDSFDSLNGQILDLGAGH